MVKDNNVNIGRVKMRSTKAGSSASSSSSSSTANAKKFPWSREEDFLLLKHVQAFGEGRWSELPHKAGLVGRSPQSCRFRWKNYLRPDIKHAAISPEEEDLIIRLHRLVGNRWSLIAGRVPGRTDNQIKNFWYTQMRKKHAADQPTGVQSQTSSITAESPITNETDNNMMGDGFEMLNTFGEEASFLLFYPPKEVAFTGDFEIKPSYSDNLLEVMDIFQGNCNYLNGFSDVV
ncbi:hypothetical protein KI387_015126 [Taxus chinensis]|uniref:Uncharacterized protein n=1 Tax=Taxus chinensis TaxID=29808 RepID=A0AA38GBF2_TAXCH|nr:hypothetical protein KI387_015126 [Taxus chinensis]